VNSFNFQIQTGMTTRTLLSRARMSVYSVASGKAPVNAKGEIVASESSAPAPGTSMNLFLSIQMVMDETKGDTEYQPEYTFTGITWAEKVAVQFSDRDGSTRGPDASYHVATEFKIPEWTGSTEGTGANNPYVRPYSLEKLVSKIRVSMGSFLVKSIVIRNPTPSEIWASIGGAYGGAILILAVFFSDSGLVDEDGNQVVVFNFVTSGMKDAWLQRFRPDDHDLEERLAALEAGMTHARGVGVLQNSLGVLQNSLETSAANGAPSRTNCCLPR